MSEGLYTVNTEVTFVAKSEEDAQAKMLRILNESKTFREWSRSGIIQTGDK